MSGAGRKTEQAWQKTMERKGSAEPNVAERERSGKRAESAAHSLLTVAGERGDSFC